MANHQVFHISTENMNSFEKMFNLPKLGWEYSNHSNNFIIIPVDGSHDTMMTDPKNRSFIE